MHASSRFAMNVLLPCIAARSGFGMRVHPYILIVSAVPVRLYGLLSC